MHAWMRLHTITRVLVCCRVTCHEHLLTLICSYIISMLTVVIKLHSIRVHIELHYYYYSRHH